MLFQTQHRTIELRRDGRVAEGAPLLREYGFKKPIEGSNPSLSASIMASSVPDWLPESSQTPVNLGFFVPYVTRFKAAGHRILWHVNKRFSVACGFSCRGRFLYSNANCSTFGRPRKTTGVSHHSNWCTSCPAFLTRSAATTRTR